MFPEGNQTNISNFSSWNVRMSILAGEVGLINYGRWLKPVKSTQNGFIAILGFTRCNTGIIY